ncbi:histidine kinase famiy protein [Caballeronia sp. AZ10_KS36]|uniref:histidine kinase famiy protein n=1 Tax=Caballeronia sp. AZ10_KS36 TaxID=2921757 RepID=UPI00253F6CD4|nr:histidine kinase famiy protein [Caballeronia sp. AZ10_KS36]
MRPERGQKLNIERPTVSNVRPSFSDHSNDIFFAAVSTTRMPMLVTDPNQPDNPIVFVNSAFLNLTGFSVEELIGQNCRLLQGPETSQATVSEIRDSVLQGREINIEVLNYRKDGSTFWNALFISPVRNEAGDIVYFFASQLDISRRRDAEEALRQSQKMEALGQLTGGIAHDFNNLLQVMSGYVDVMKLGIEERFDLSRFVMPVERMRDAITRASTLTQQLLAFARKQELRGRIINLNARLADIRELAENTFGDSGALNFVPDPALRNCQLDASQLEVAVLNLLLNARDALNGKDKPQVTVRTGNLSLTDRRPIGFAQLTPGEYVWVSVSDNGTGIPAHILAHVMDPFFTTKEEGKGTGLGLSMVYGFARQSGGAVDIYSEPGHGTTVRLYFPAVAAETSIEQRHRRVAESAHNETILVVDDRPDVAEVAAMILQQGGYKTRVAHGAHDALEILGGDAQIELLFTDLIMPGGMNGVMLAQEAKRRKPLLRVLLTTGYADTSIARNDIDGTEFPVLHKPYQAIELRAAISQALHNPGTDS